MESSRSGSRAGAAGSLASRRPGGSPRRERSAGGLLRNFRRQRQRPLGPKQTNGPSHASRNNGRPALRNAAELAAGSVRTFDSEAGQGRPWERSNMGLRGLEWSEQAEGLRGPLGWPLGERPSRLIWLIWPTSGRPRP